MKHDQQRKCDARDNIKNFVCDLFDEIRKDLSFRERQKQVHIFYF